MTLREKIYITNKKVEIIHFYGARCNNPKCQRHYNLGVNPLEFAHIRENDISGMGRGSHQRILSVARNIKKMKEGKDQEYILLCKKCHKEFDDHVWY